MPSERLSAIGGSYASPETTSARIKFRRALTLAVMTLIVPGSAQMAAGNKRVGRIAMRLWLGIIVLALLGVLLSFVSRSAVFSLVTNSTVMTIMRWVLIALAVFWVVLLIDAWRLGAPLELIRKHRLIVTGLNSTLCVMTAGALFFGAHVLSVQQDFIGSVFASGTTSESEGGRYNVLLLGGDSGTGRDGLRPDSLTVASIDQKTGRTVLVGLPRNLANVPFPKGSVMRKQFPRGFDCEGCYLNSVNTWANDNKDLFDGGDAGIEVTKDAVSETTGLKINYFAMVNLKGFRSLVDAVGGVQIEVKDRIAIGGIGSPIRGYIEPGTKQLSGDETLWYARSRVESNDYARMGRQKCVMSAMLQQLSPQNALLNIQEIADSGKELLSTDIPAGDLNVFMDLALKARDADVSSVSVTPPKVNTSDPDFGKIQSMVSAAIEDSEREESASDAFVTAALPKLSKPTEAYDPADEAQKANETSDLASVC